MVSILYAEDDEMLRVATKKYLQYHNFSVDTASSGHEALKKMSMADYDAVIADYEMPGMNGIDLLKEVRKQNPGMPFILFTGRGAEDVAVEAFECGADYYVQKGGMIDTLFTELIFKLTRAIEHRRVEEILVLSRLTLDNSGDAIFWIDHTGAFFYANEAASKILGYQEEELLSMRLPDINPYIQAENWNAYWQEISTRNHQNKELLLVRKNGDPVPAEVVINRMEYKGKQFLCMFARDITERIQIEKKLNRYTRSLEQSNEQLKTLSQELKKQSEELDKRVQERTAEVQNLLQKRTELITQIGHDLKTPLTSILALLSYIGKKEQDRNLLEYIEVVIEDAKRMKHLIASTLDLLYYESGHHVNPKITSNLLSAVTRAVESEHLQIAKKEIRIIVQVSDTISIGMPDAHLEAICSNLITNAVKYSPDNESITITADIESEYLSFVVADTGIGLSSEEIPRIFEEFYKADSSRHDGESHGLGLSIIKRIVESYSGTIRAYSEGKGKGTVFTVNFPK